MQVPRFRIVGVMALIAIVALELGAMRAISYFASPDMTLAWLVPMLGLGSLAMVNVLAIGLLIGYRWRGSRSFLLGFEVFGATALALYIAGTIRFAEDLMPLVNAAIRPLVDRFRDGPYMSTVNIFVVNSIIAVILSLPQLAFAAIGGFLTYRRSALGIAAVLSGPPVGASLAWLGISLGKMHPADMGFYALMGAIVGLFTGITLVLAGLFCPRDSCG